MIILSQIILFVTVLAAITNLNIFKKSRIKTMYIVISGVFLSVWAASVFIDFNSSNHFDKTQIFLSLMHGIQVMLAGFEFENMYVVLAASDKIYIYLAFLFTVAPVCTFGFVLSFFKGLNQAAKYISKFGRDAYIISEINEKTVILAKSIKETDKRSLIIFRNVAECGENLIRKAEMTGAVLSKKEIKDITLKLHSKKSKASFFLINENESKNLEDAITLINRFKAREKSELYVSSTSDEGMILLDSIRKENMKVRRINENRQLAYFEVLKKEGEKALFDYAKQSPDKKDISVLVAGMGGFGTELVKALLWCGQLPGINIKITVVDKNPEAKTYFSALCPEIAEKNGNKVLGESCFDLKIYGGADVESLAFAEIITSLDDADIVYTALGDDKLNIETAIKIRALLKRKNITPIIKAVVCSDEKYNMLSGRKLTNYKNQSYDIDVTGNISSRYSLSGVTGEYIEKLALEHHMSYAAAYYENSVADDEKKESALNEIKAAAKKDFNEYEYLRNSSVASAIYRTQFEKRDYSDGEISEMAMYEHMRWNTYMRCEGFVYSDVRCDIAKQHNDLKPYSELTQEEIHKDIKMVKTLLLT